MRIVIETDDQANPAAAPGTALEAETGREGAPPPEVAAQAVAFDASSAGPAPPEAAAEGPPPFVEEPGTPETTPEAGRAATGALSAGAAPEFATGAVAVEQIEVDEEAEETEA
jgi:hypothetical protein